MTTHKKSVLGRGLNALIPKSSQVEVNIYDKTIGHDTGKTGIIANVEIAKIKPNPYQPRIDFKEEALAELTSSIKEKGIIQPVTVRRFENGYQLISGERRLRAAQKANLKYIPAYIISVKSDEELLELSLIENIQRERLNPLEIANAYKRLIDECNLTQEEIAKRVGQDRTTITNFIRLLKLPEIIQEGLRKEKISMGHARALINIQSERLQLRLYEKIIDQGLSVRKVEELVRSFGLPKKRSGAVKQPEGFDSDIQSMQEKLQHALGTKVRVRPKSRTQGEIVIEYYSLEDFERLLELFTSGK